MSGIINGGQTWQSISLVSNTNGTGTSLTLPTGSAAGDLFIVMSLIVNTDDSSLPSNPTPTGITMTTDINFTSTPGGNKGTRNKLYHKILTAGDITTGSVGGLGSDNVVRHNGYTFRPAKPVNGVDVLFTDCNNTTNNPAALVTTGVVNERAPVVVVAQFTADTNFTSYSMSPTQDDFRNPTSQYYYMAKIFNEVDKSEVTIDMDDEGGRNSLMLGAYAFN